MYALGGSVLDLHLKRQDGTARHSMARYGTVRHSTARYGTVWLGTVTAATTVRYSGHDGTAGAHDGAIRLVDDPPLDDRLYRSSGCARMSGSGSATAHSMHLNRCGADACT